MNRKRNFETRVFILLRKMGFLCKKPKEPERRYRIGSTVNYDGTITTYAEPLKEMPVNPNSLNAEINVYLQEKKLARPNCKFDTVKLTCECGRGINDFLSNCKEK
jgi:hypothetical protein